MDSKRNLSRGCCNLYCMALILPQRLQRQRGTNMVVYMAPTTTAFYLLCDIVIILLSLKGMTMVFSASFVVGLAVVFVKLF